MKQLLLTAVFALFTLSAMADEQKPLYIVDGKVMSAEEIKSLSESLDIESMTIVKDKDDIAPYAELGDVSNGVVIITTKQQEAPQIDEMQDIDQMPKFMNGEVETFVHWVMLNMRYPEEARKNMIQGMVIAEFVVGKDGYIDTEHIIFHDNCDPLLHEEIIRLFKIAPQWTPATQNGANVATKFTIPVSFQLQIESTPDIVIQG